MVETVVGVSSRSYLLALENLERYRSHMHSITLINFPINSISPTPSMFSHSLHPLFLPVGEFAIINRLDCIRKCNFILHNHNNTKTFHTIESDVGQFGT
ncbi:hypothetical protein Bca4012_078764 [Brassica carinata]